jgi:hypothetical protein
LHYAGAFQYIIGLIDANKKAMIGLTGSKKEDLRQGAKDARIG